MTATTDANANAHYLVELYTPTAKWHALSRDERARFFEAVQHAMPKVTGEGVIPVAFGEIDPLGLQPARQRFFAIWAAPKRSGIQALLTAIADSGWYRFFETVNAAGVGLPLEAHVAQLVTETAES